MNTNQTYFSLADVARSLGRSPLTIERSLERAGIEPIEVRCAGRTVLALAPEDVRRLRELPGLAISPFLAAGFPSVPVAVQ